MGDRYFVRYLEDIVPVPCYCGSSTRILPAADGCPVNVHITHITDSRKHYHRDCTEVYYILEGQGTLELGEESFALRPGALAYIPAGVAHRGYGDFRALIVGLPPLQPGDELFTD